MMDTKTALKLNAERRKREADEAEAEEKVRAEREKERRKRAVAGAKRQREAEVEEAQSVVLALEGCVKALDGVLPAHDGLGSAPARCAHDSNLPDVVSRALGTAAGRDATTDYFLGFGSVAAVNASGLMAKPAHDSRRVHPPFTAWATSVALQAQWQGSLHPEWQSEALTAATPIVPFRGVSWALGTERPTAQLRNGRLCSALPRGGTSASHRATTSAIDVQHGLSAIDPATRTPNRCHWDCNVTTRASCAARAAFSSGWWVVAPRECFLALPAPVVMTPKVRQVPSRRFSRRTVRRSSLPPSNVTDQDRRSFCVGAGALFSVVCCVVAMSSLIPLMSGYL